MKQLEFKFMNEEIELNKLTYEELTKELDIIIKNLNFENSNDYFEAINNNLKYINNSPCPDIIKNRIFQIQRLLQHFIHN